MQKLKKIVFMDLDGTLLKSDQTFSLNTIQTLKKLKQMGIFLVIVTGRSLFSFRKVIDLDFPIDYLIYSTGAGIYDWNKQQLLFSQSINGILVKKVLIQLLNKKLDFMIHKEIPNNHEFYYYRANSNKNLDFERRVLIYKKYAKEITSIENLCDSYCQLLSILNKNQGSILEDFRKLFPELKIIRATSPLNHESIWMEIFPANVSKSQAAYWLTKYLNIPKHKTISIGNDYNDEDLLDWTEKSFVVNNAPIELKRKFQVVKSNDEDGFSEAMEREFLFLNAEKEIDNS